MTTEKVLKAYKIYQSAIMYGKAARTLDRNSDIMPSQILAALTLEILFKSLFYLENGRDFKINNKHSHDFNKLFIELSESTKTEMRQFFDIDIAISGTSNEQLIANEVGQILVSDLEGLLEQWKDVFVKFRYIYDIEIGGKQMLFFPQLEASLKSVILNRMPAWDV